MKDVVENYLKGISEKLPNINILIVGSYASGHYEYIDSLSKDLNSDLELVFVGRWLPCKFLARKVKDHFDALGIDACIKIKNSLVYQKVVTMYDFDEFRWGISLGSLSKETQNSPALHEMEPFLLLINRRLELEAKKIHALPLSRSRKKLEYAAKMCGFDSSVAMSDRLLGRELEGFAISGVHSDYRSLKARLVYFLRTWRLASLKYGTMGIQIEVLKLYREKGVTQEKLRNFVKRWEKSIG